MSFTERIKEASLHALPIIGSYFAKNGVVLPESEVYITTNGTGRFESCTIHTLVQLSTNDYIEVWVENNTGANNILVTDLNVIVK